MIFSNEKNTQKDELKNDHLLNGWVSIEMIILLF